MMELPHRDFITGEPLDAFLHGAEIALTKKRMKKIQLARLSIKQDSHGIETLQSMWGRPERAAMAVFSRKPISVGQFTKEDWLQAGKFVGATMENWVDNDAEFDRSDNKALGLQFNIWKTSETWDRTQDLLDVLEHDFATHINGKFHWRVRKALAELIEMMFCDVNTNVGEHLATPEGLDALKAIAQRAGFELTKKKAPVKEVA